MNARRLRLGGGVEEEVLKHRGFWGVANFDPVTVDVRLYKFLKTHRTYCTKVWILIFAKQKIIIIIRRLRGHKM